MLEVHQHDRYIYITKYIIITSIHYDMKSS